MKTSYMLILVSLLATFSVSANEACKFDIKFTSDPKLKEQTITVAPNVDLKIKQFISVQTVKDAKIADNVMCQQLIGQQYTGSADEWKGFINSAFQGLLNADFKDVKFTKVGTDDAAYKGTLANMEYTFTGNTGGNKQVIHNLAVLDKKNNQVITLSVSGNEKVSEEIKEEYFRLVSSFVL